MKEQISRRDFLKGAASAAVIGIASVNLGGCVTSAPETVAAPTAVPSSPAPVGIYTPGTYTASTDGFGKVTVSMTFDANYITDIVLDVSNETATIGGASGDALRQSILDAQSADIDVVSGATITSNAVKKAAANCIAQAKGEAAALTASGRGTKEVVDWLGREPEIAESDISETVNTEVLIVGAGTGGMFTACSAGEQGAKTLVVDKYEKGGGIRDDLGAVNSRYQKKWGTRIDKFEYITEFTNIASGHIDQRLVKLFCEESGETIDWYGDRLEERGIELWHEAGGDDPDDRYLTLATGHSPRWAGSDDGTGNRLNGNTVLFDYAADLGVDFRYNTKMLKLVKEGGKVTGIIAQDEKTGNYIKIIASKGTIVCCGGYSLNYDMLEALQPQNLACVGRNGSVPGATGDGIRACIWAGAKFDHTHSTMMFDRTALKLNQKPGREQCENGDSGMFWMGSQPWLKVNSDGERFFNESGTYAGILHADEYNKGNCHYTIFDSDWTNYVQEFKTHGCSRLTPFPNGADPNMGHQVIENGMLPNLIEQGYVFQCDTIEELAKNLELPADKLQATIDRYNALYDRGVDDDFGKEAHRMSAVRKAPFYGVKNTGYILCTMDGIQINTDMQAIDTNCDVIPGLYVIGNDSGGFFSGDYPNLSTGVACGRTVTFGRRAGRIVANL